MKKIKLLLITLTLQSISLFGIETTKSQTHVPPQGINNKKKSITLGTTSPTSGGLSTMGEHINHGINLIFDKYNETKDIKNFYINFISYDDEYKESKAQRNIQEILNQTNILFAPFGTEALSYIPQTNNHFVLFPVTSSEQFRSSSNNSIIFFQASLKKEVETLCKHAIEKIKATKIAAFYENAPWGKEGTKYIKQYIDTYNSKHPNAKISLVSTGAYEKNTVNIKNAATKIISDNPNLSPDAIICVANYRAAYAFIRNISNSNMKCKFYTTNEAAIIQPDLKKSRGIKMVYSSSVPNPWSSPLQIAKEYRQAMTDNLPYAKLSIASFEGFIIASLFIEALKNISLPITMQKIISYITSLKEFKGLKFSWNPNKRTLLNSIWLSTGPNATWQQY